MKKIKWIWLLAIIVYVMMILAFSVPVNALAPEKKVNIPENIKGNDIKEYAFLKVTNYWNDGEWDSFEKIIDKESGWKLIEYHNKNISSAYGLAGFLDKTWASVGCVKTSDPYKQIDCAVLYISKRYDTPHLALAFHKKENWY